MKPKDICTQMRVAKEFVYKTVADFKKQAHRMDQNLEVLLKDRVDELRILQVSHKSWEG